MCVLCVLSAVDFGNFDFGQRFFRVRPISTSANFDFGQFGDVEFLDHKGWGPEGWRPKPRKKSARRGLRPTLASPILANPFLAKKKRLVVSGLANWDHSNLGYLANLFLCVALCCGWCWVLVLFYVVCFLTCLLCCCVLCCCVCGSLVVSLLVWTTAGHPTAGHPSAGHRRRTPLRRTTQNFFFFPSPAPSRRGFHTTTQELQT